MCFNYLELQPGAGGVAQEVEHLPSMCKAMGLIPSMGAG